MHMLFRLVFGVPRLIYAIFEVLEHGFTNWSGVVYRTINLVNSFVDLLSLTIVPANLHSTVRPKRKE
ncbi:hypothetical protein AAVH_41117 [Aphelenchoides avenae]|nr:hypothetical protein AAVH_41117 [Aphelenchus avenae]